MIAESKDELICWYSDVFKEVYGVRPRNNFTQWSEEKLEAEIAGLNSQLKVIIDAEKETEKVGIAEFENKVKQLRLLGAKNREQAIMWLMQGTGENDERYQRMEVEYDFNLPSGYLSR